MNGRSDELVSIIIPVYNTRDYLERCINSALNQTHKNLQVILIDDGSTDGGLNICESYAANDFRVEVIRQDNAGQSAARNTGLDRVRGRWIAFLDSDDYISNQFVELNLNACLKYDADIAISKYTVDYDGNLTEDDFVKTDIVEQYNNRETILQHFSNNGSLFNIVCCKLFKASLWEGLRFPVGMIWEDLFISHRMLYGADVVVVLDSHLYAYYMAPGSTMRKPFSLKRLDALEAWNEGVRFFTEVGEHEYSDIARRILCNRLFDAYNICRKKLPDEREIHKNLRLRSIDIYSEVRGTRSYIDLTPRITFAFRVKQFIGRYSPPLYSVLFIKKHTYNI